MPSLPASDLALGRGERGERKKNNFPAHSAPPRENEGW